MDSAQQCLVALVGIGCRLPGKVYSPKDFFNLLRGKKSAIDKTPQGRWSIQDFVSQAGGSGKTVTDRAGWLTQIDRFDHGFFRISPREAREMDPQQRLVLEVALEAIADAQLEPAMLRERTTGVYVGAGFAEFQGLSFGDPARMTQHSMLGTSLSIIANRLSYALDIHGPSMTVDTACSSAMTAFHLACQALRAGECDVALVAGVNTMLGPSPFIGYTQASMLSPTGSCTPFDAEADGFVRGEGCGVVVLQRAEDLRRDPVQQRQRTYAHVRWSGVNEDGRTASVTMPSSEHQERLMSRVIEQSGVALEDIVYVEAHGTGTAVGDPIEAHSIAKAHVGTRETPLAMGSVKGHIGHLETAAGIAGLIKAALCLHHKTLVPTAGFHRWSPKIDAHALKLRIPVEPESLPVPGSGRPALMGVCSYGFGGANAYTLLQEAVTELAQPEVSTKSEVGDDAVFVLPLSAHYEEGVRSLEAAWRRLPDEDLRDAAAWSGRSLQRAQYRQAWVGRTGQEFWSEAQHLRGEHAGASPRVLFCFGGQGSQSSKMAHLLYARSEAFRAQVREADALFAKHAGYSLTERHGFCLGEMDEAAMLDVTVALPCIVLTQVGLVALLREAGVEASAVIGHSTGEMVAGWVAGAYDLETLCLLTHIRASMQAKMRDGAMAAWNQSVAEAEAVIAQLGLSEAIVVAAENTRDSVSLAGDTEAIEQIVAWGKAQGIRCVRLPVPKAYHSHHVDGIAEELRERLAAISATAPQLPFVSSVAGKAGILVQTPLDAAYWFDNIRQPVHFLRACLAAESYGQLALEVSPHRVLWGYLKDNVTLPLVACLNRKQRDDLSFSQALATLFTKGLDIRWQAWQQPQRWVKIPSLPWQHEQAFRSEVWRLPQDETSRTKSRVPSATVTRSASAETLVIAKDTHAALQDHVIDGQTVMPGAAYLAELLPFLPQQGTLSDIEFHRLLILWRDQQPTILSVERDEDTYWLQQGEHRYMSLRCVTEPNVVFLETMSGGDLAEVRQRCDKTVDLRRLYQAYDQHAGLSFGEAFRGVASLSLGDGEGWATLAPPRTDAGLVDSVFTTVLDACFQTLLMIKGVDADRFLPQRIALFRQHRAMPRHAALFCHTMLTGWSAEHLIGDLDLYTREGARVLSLSGIQLQRTRSAAHREARCWQTSWQSRALPASVAERAQQAKSPQMWATLIADCVAKQHRFVRLLDLTGDTLPAIWKHLPDELRSSERLFAVTTGAVPSDVPHGLHRYATLEQVVVSNFDFVWGVAGELLQTQNDKDAHPQSVLVLGPWNEHWLTQKAENFDEADVILDSRGDLYAASTLLGQLRRAERKPALVVLCPNQSLLSHASLTEEYDRSVEDATLLWGWARAARNECPELSIYTLGVPWLDTSEETIVSVTSVLETLPHVDYELCLDAREEGPGQWMVPRLQTHTPAQLSNDAFSAVGLRAMRPGQLSSLQWIPIQEELVSLRKGEVKLAVQSVSLHFKDVMLAMGMLEGFQPILGMECCGTIEALGPDVAAEFPSLAVGMPVLCLAMSADQGEQRSALLGSKAFVQARQVLPLPSGFAPHEAAGFLGVMATAWYALKHIARLAPGETVLIHSAAGGVGQAAVQVAQSLGATAIVSAGTPEKREMLRETFGLPHVLDSHDPACFVPGVKTATDGAGVDVVLNSLAGDGLSQSLRCLRPGGRHIEIGKRDIFADRALGLAVLRNNISFHSVQLDLLDETHPQKVRALLEECLSLLEEGALRPIETTVYPASEVVEAFRWMSTGKHTGKIVVDLPEDTHSLLPTPSEGCALPLPETLFSASDTHLITGGTRGLGLMMARFLVEHGAEHVLLVGRRGRLSRRDGLWLSSLREEYPHCKIEVQALDVCDAAAVDALFEATSPAIRSVFHAANLYAGGDAHQLKRDDKGAMAVKWQGALHLHEATRERSMRHFVLFSSLAGLHGNTHQAAYVASNAALQRFAVSRRSVGLPALALDLPMMLGAGRLSESGYVRELDLNASKGFGALSFSQIEPFLRQIFAQPERMPAHLSLDAPMWDGYLRLQQNYSFFEHLIPARREIAVPGSSLMPATETDVMSHAPDLAVVTNDVMKRIAFVLGCRPQEVKLAQPLVDLGVDSLAAIELVDWVEEAYGLEVTQTEFLGGLTTEALIDTIASAQQMPAMAVWDSPGSERHDPTPEIAEEVIKRVGFVLGCRAEEVKLSQPLVDLGVDSLAAIELADWTIEQYQVEVTQTEFLGGLTTDALIARIASAQEASPMQQTHLSTEGARKEALASGKSAVRIDPLKPASVPTATSVPKLEDVRLAQAARLATPSYVHPFVLGATFDETTETTQPLCPVREAEIVTLSKSPRAEKSERTLHLEQTQVEDEETETISGEFFETGLGADLVWERLGLYVEPHRDRSHQELLVPETLNVSVLESLLASLRASHGVVVLRGTPGSDVFCAGMDLAAAPFGSEAMSRGLVLYGELLSLLESREMPTIVVVDGACRGGGLIFPSLATVVLATHKASFGFPEIRRGGLPGMVSVAATTRMSRAQCQRYMLTGDVFDAERAQLLGLVDFVGDAEAVEIECERLHRRFRTIDASLLESCQRYCPSGSQAEALVAMGSLHSKPPRRLKGQELVRLLWQADAGVAVLELYDPRHANAMGRDIADDLRRAIQTLQQQENLRAVVLQGAGAHFCVGVNPYHFMREAQEWPATQAAHLIYSIYRAFVGVRDLAVPVVCAVHGKVLGGGLAAMLNTDYRISAADASFHYGNLPRGVCPGLLLSENLPRSVGGTSCMELYLQDQVLDAEAALVAGLVHELATDMESAQRAALRLALRLASQPPLGIKRTLALLRPSIDEARLAQESVWMAECNREGGAFQGDWREELASPTPLSATRTERAVPKAETGPITAFFTSPQPTPSKQNQRAAPYDSFASSSQRAESTSQTQRRAQNVGIQAMELYIPQHYTTQSALERLQNCPGRYTTGLGQQEIAFCGDDEDAISMALTVVNRMMERFELDWYQIGRLEVGTESLTDRSKSIKTHLMSLFARHGCFDVEGVDSYNACYGGTAALFNSVAWCQSEAWDGRLALVVCVDIADLNAEQQFLNGAAAVAMLVGPDAPVVMLPERASYMMNTWDFYKPVGWEDPYPLMRDGKHSIDVYMRSLDGCQRQLSKKIGRSVLDAHDHFVFHCTSVYLCQRAFDRLVMNDDGDRLSLQQRRHLYEQMVNPSTQITRRTGSTYTASCYVNLYSLFAELGGALRDKRIGVYSYGSGSAASLYRLQVHALPLMDMAIQQRLERRRFYEPDTFIEWAQQYSKRYGDFGFLPSRELPRQVGVFYLDRVDEWGRRFYVCEQEEGAEPLEPTLLAQDNLSVKS